MHSCSTNPKPEIPKAEGRPKSEVRKNRLKPSIRISDFGILSVFGPRISDFRHNTELARVCYAPKEQASAARSVLYCDNEWVIHVHLNWLWFRDGGTRETHS